MRPTLYAEDVMHVMLDTLHHPEFDDTLDAREALRRVLPRRCPSHPNLTTTGDWAVGMVCSDGCEGQGFLFPEMPDWWEKRWADSLGQMEDATLQGLWEAHCVDTWRAMKVVEDE